MRFAYCLVLFGLSLSLFGLSQAQSSLRSSLTQSCDSGSSEDCYKAGLLNLTGQDGAPKDYARAHDQLSLACEQAIAKACFSLATMYFNGEGVQKDYAIARIHYKQACDGNQPEGCFFLGQLYGHGAGGPKDMALFKQYVRKACAEGYELACE